MTLIYIINKINVKLKEIIYILKIKEILSRKYNKSTTTRSTNSILITTINKQLQQSKSI